MMTTSLSRAPETITPVPPRPRRQHGRTPVLLVVIATLVPGSILAAVALGAVDVDPIEVLTIAGHHLFGQALPSSSLINDQIIWNIRVPRVLTAFLVGAALAVAGAVLQAVIRNPLADPYVLGITSGASFAAVSVIVLGATGGGLLAMVGTSGAAFVGALGTLVLVLLLGRRAGRVDTARLVLAGVAISYLFQAGTSYLQIISSPDLLSNVLFWLLGSVAGASWPALAVPTIILVACACWLMIQGRNLNALMLGDDVASSVGVNLSRFRMLLLIVSALLTAVVVAVAGGVGFVGLIAPHFVRLVLGPDHVKLLPFSALIGGTFLVISDLVGRTIAAPIELPLSVVTAVIGVPVFLIVLLRSQSTSRGRA